MFEALGAEIVAALVAAVVGLITGGGLTGWFLKRWIEKKLSFKENISKEELEDRRADHQLHEQFMSDIKWLLMWMKEWAINENGEQKFCESKMIDAYNQLDATNKAMRDHRRKWEAKHKEK